MSQDNSRCPRIIPAVPFPKKTVEIQRNPKFQPRSDFPLGIRVKTLGIGNFSPGQSRGCIPNSQAHFGKPNTNGISKSPWDSPIPAEHSRGDGAGFGAGFTLPGPKSFQISHQMRQAGICPWMQGQLQPGLGHFWGISGNSIPALPSTLPKIPAVPALWQFGAATIPL